MPAGLPALVIAMDQRRFLLFIIPFTGIFLILLSIVLFFSNTVVVGIILLLIGVQAIWIPRRVLYKHEEVMQNALDMLDPEGNSTEEPNHRIERVAALHGEEIKREVRAREELKASFQEMDASRKKEKARADEEVKTTRRQLDRLTEWLDNTPGALLRVDSAGIIRWANPGAAELVPDSVGKQVNRLLNGWKQGRSGAFMLRRKSGEIEVMVDSTPPEIAQGESSFLLIRDLSSENALMAARETAERAREQLRSVISSIAPQATPEDTLQEIAPLIFKVVPAKEMTLALPGERDSETIRTWTKTRTDPVREEEVAQDTTLFQELLSGGKEKLILDLQSEGGGVEIDSLTARGLNAVGLFPLEQGSKVIASVRFAFRTEEDLSPGIVATLHQLLPAVARAVRGARRFQEMKLHYQQWQWYLENLPDPVFLCTPEGEVRYQNRLAQSMVSDLATEEGRMDRIIPEGDRNSFLIQLKNGYEKGRARFETPLEPSKEGGSGEVNLIRMDLGEEGLLLCVLRDISKRKAEAAEVHRREEEAGELYQLALDLGRSLDLQWVMEQIFTKALEVTNLDFGWTTLIEHETGSRDLASCYKIDLEVVRELYDEHGHAGFEDRVLRTKKPVVLESLSEDPTIHPDVIQRSGIRSLISVPLLLDGEVVGVLNLASSSFYQFKVQDIENLGTFGRIFARGVSNSKRFYEARRRADTYKMMISEQHSKLKGLSEDTVVFQDRLVIYRELLEFLWGGKGALLPLVSHALRPEGPGAGSTSSDWSLALAVSRALSQYLVEPAGEASPTDLERFAFALKKDDSGVADSAENLTPGDTWEVRDPLPKVFMVPSVVRDCMKALLVGFRSLAIQPYFIVFKPSIIGAVIEITIQSRDPFGTTQELQEAITRLKHSRLPSGRPSLALVLLFLVNRVLQRQGAGIRITRGEGNQITLILEFRDTIGDTDFPGGLADG